MILYSKNIKMPKKLIIALVSFILLAAGMTFFLIYQNKLGLFSNLKQTSEEKTTPVNVSAVEKEGNFYIIRGRLAGSLKYDEQKENLVGQIIINGDPQETPVTFILTSGTTGGEMSYAEYKDAFVGVPSVRLSTLDEIKDLVKNGDQIELRLNADVKSYTKREINKYEQKVLDTLAELSKGNWVNLTDPQLIIFTSGIGIIM
jgi:hypothetical protein